MIIFWYLVGCFATWRLTSIFQLEDVFTPVRSWLGVKHHDDPELRVYPDNLIGRLISCFWCVSVWVAAFVAIWFILVTQISWWFLPGVIPAMSAVSIVIQEIRYESEQIRKERNRKVRPTEEALRAARSYLMQRPEWIQAVMQPELVFARFLHDHQIYLGSIEYAEWVTLVDEIATLVGKENDKYT